MVIIPQQVLKLIYAEANRPSDQYTLTEYIESCYGLRYLIACSTGVCADICDSKRYLVYQIKFGQHI